MLVSSPAILFQTRRCQSSEVKEPIAGHAEAGQVGAAKVERLEKGVSAPHDSADVKYEIFNSHKAVHEIVGTKNLSRR